MTLRPGLILAAVFLCVYGTFALVVNLPKATYAFKSDEATYYMMGLSLVHDGDLTYRKEDLTRVWREFPGEGGITGLLLLTESHLACHTFPERGFAAFNLYCCQPREDWPWAERLREALRAQRVSVRRLARGEP